MMIEMCITSNYLLFISYRGKPTAVNVTATDGLAATAQSSGTLQCSYPELRAYSAKNQKITEGSLYPSAISNHEATASIIKTRQLPELKMGIFGLNC